MAATEEQLFARFEELGIETTTKRHPPVFTVGEAKALRGDLLGGHCKSLFLKDKKGALWLVVCLEDRRMDMKALQAAIGSGRLSFGKPDLLIEVMGVEPGSVTPFGLINDTEQRINVVLDQRMMGLSPLNYHPLKNDATTQIAPADLERFVRACGHEPRVVDLDAVS